MVRGHTPCPVLLEQTSLERLVSNLMDVFSVNGGEGCSQNGC